jgi:hypothetical protein
MFRLRAPLGRDYRTIMPAFPFDIIAFDLDGTLADTAPDLTAALNHTLDRLGFPTVPAGDVRHMVGHGAKALLRKGLAAASVEDEALVERGFPIFLDHYAAHIADHSFAFPGCEAALNRLSARGVTLAICTNKLESLARRFVAEIGWSGRREQARPDAPPRHDRARGRRPGRFRRRQHHRHDDCARSRRPVRGTQLRLPRSPARGARRRRADRSL